MKFQLFIGLLTSVVITNSAFAQSTCDTAAFDQCKAACVTAQPSCETQPPLTITEVREAIALKCGCTVTDGATEADPDTCACTEKVRNYGNYRSCVAQLSDSLKAFKLSSEEARNQLKADNSLCKSVINDNKGGNSGNGNGKGGKGKDDKGGDDRGGDRKGKEDK